MKPEPQRLRPYRGDNYCDAGGLVCGIATLTPLDMVTSKLLANSDRWNDDGVFSRDLIDLAMMNPSLALLRQAVAKAEHA